MLCCHLFDVELDRFASSYSCPLGSVVKKTIENLVSSAAIGQFVLLAKAERLAVVKSTRLELEP